MLGEPLRLRNRRELRSPRRGGRGRGLALLAVVAAVAAGAYVAPMAQSALAPLGIAPFGAAVQVPAVDGPAAASVANVPVVAVPVVPTAVPQQVQPQAQAPGGLTAPPTLAPLPTAIPPLGPDGVALLNSIKSDREAQWLKNHAETAFRAGPNDQAPMFTLLPQWSTLKQIETQPGWIFVLYGGDGDTRQPGPGWIKSEDAGAIGTPSIWLRSSRPTPVFGSAEAAARSMDIPPGALMEVIGPQIIQGQRVRVRFPGDGRGVPPAEGWADAGGLMRARTPNFFELPAAYPDVLSADIRLKVPYRSQLDGSDYAGSNCGPTTLGMALEAFGVNVPQPLLRGDVLISGELDPDDYESGTYIWALARVAQSNGVRTYGLYEEDGQTLHRWSVDEVRANVRAGRPVIAQVVYRGLPGREDSSYYGDHYVIITGLIGDDFLYNDPIGGPDAAEPPGWDRRMTAAQLRRAMRASDTPYAFTAFALGRS